MKLKEPLKNAIPDIMYFSDDISKTGAQNNA